MSNLDHLNDHASMPSPQVRTDNQRYWLERYRTAPSITPEGMAPSGGAGFIDDKKLNDPDKVNRALAAREHELKNTSSPQDRDRLSLLLAAEKAHCKESKAKARSALGALIQYDVKHGHPAVVDPNRDLNAQPYTAVEQSRWHRRDGRELTSQELGRAHGLDWQNPMVHKEQQRAAPEPPEGKWYLHPANESARKQQVELFKQQEREAELVRQGRVQVPTLDKRRIEQHRERT